MESPAERTGSLSTDDARFMDAALELAHRGWGRVYPNPLVGCVVVRDGEVVGRGWHAEWGGDHAEVMALAEAGPRARGSTVYVTLEPCDHHGKTPPCTEALVAAGVARVVFGADDPGEDSGGGARRLVAAGVDTIGPVLDRADARELDPVFFHDDPDRPWVGLKLAVSLDGRIAEAQGVRSRISGPESDEEVQRLRAGFGALMVGANTALIDDPRLTVRGNVTPRVPPVRVVLDGSGRLRPDARLLSDGGPRTLILTSDRSPQEWRALLRAAGADVIVADGGPTGGVSIHSALRTLRDEGVASVLCEGGGRLGTALLQARTVDRLYLVIAPSILGSSGTPAFPGADGGGAPPSRWRHVSRPTRRGEDLWLVCEPEES